MLPPLSRRRWVAGALATVALGAACAGGDRTLAPDGAARRPSLALAGSSSIVISQVYGGSGSSGATYQNDYVELFNRGGTTVSLAGWSVQYSSATGTGTFGSNAVTALSGSLAPGQYYLVKMAAGTGTSPLPVTGDATGSVNMSGTGGKVALVNVSTGLACNGGSAPCSDAQKAQIVDLVGYGSANYFEGSAATTATTITTAALRKNAGCTDTDDNAADFTVGTPGPRNTGSTISPCPTLIVAISPTTPSTTMGSTVPFTATAFQSGQPVAISGASWTSSNPAVATIDASGVATPAGPGTTTIGVTATTANGTGTASTTLTVIGAPATVTVAPATVSLVAGGSATLSASAVDAIGQTVPNVAFTWTSTNPGVATVSSSGVVTAVAAGTTTIAATAPNNVAGSASVSVSAAPGQATNVLVSEIHYDNSGTDAGESIEIEGDAGGSLAGWKLVLYNGSDGSSTLGAYSTTNLTQTIPSTCGTRGVVVITFGTNGIQNGDHDGWALVNAAGQVVEFRSYEGAFVATGGPAAGMTSVDIGVQEGTSTPTGRSLQRALNGTWFGPYTSTFGACNAATPPPPQSGITFTGRLPSDAPLPVGFQDQVFATLKDANTGATIPATFTWSSDTPGTATIDARGVMTALAAGTAVIRATADDGTSATLSLPTEVATFGNASLYRDPLAFGAPTDATPGDELRVTRAQYVLSYNKSAHNPNWVAYHLSKANRGDLPGYRCDCFTPDPLVVDANDAGVSTADYTGSGFDRGHMVRSNDREQAHGDQATTYYTTNIVPQYAALNQHRWGAFESYLQTVAEGAGLPDVYIFTGPRGNAGTIAGGKIVVPTHTWKVAVVLPAGMSPTSVTKASDILDVIAVDMPNASNLPTDTNWPLHRTTVDAIEAATGYDLLSALPNTIEEVVESGDRAPTARLTGAGLAGGTEGQTLAFSAETSSDPDVGGALGDAVSYLWQIDGQAAGIQPTLSYAFADNGTYQVRLIVADKFGLADTTFRMVTVLNAVPAVGALAAASISEGGAYSASGAFTDPGADTWTATVDYGDGAGAQPLALDPDKTFSLGHTYADNGSYTVTVTVTETDPEHGAGSATTTVAVANVAPAVAAFAGASIDEGSSYAAAGAFTDPGADTWTATVDYGDGTGAQPLALSGKAFSLAHTYARDGAYTVKVTVKETDAEAASGTQTATVTVANVAPSVAAFAGATILRGETYSATGSFADPGDDSWTATVNYGDGSGAQPLALSGKSFTLSHAYAVGGTFTVTVSVYDGAGTGTRTATVVVRTPAEGVGVLAGMVTALAEAGTLTSAEAGSLNAKLDAAAKQFAADRPSAVYQVQAFINEVSALQSTGRLSATDAGKLTAYAQRVIRSADA